MRVFLSAVSGQFKPCRDELASDLRAIGCEVIVQEDMQQHPRSLLEKLQRHVDQCDRVIAIVGDAFGIAPDPTVLPDDTPRRSYTQWEYLYALGQRLDLADRGWAESKAPKDIFLYFAADAYLARHPIAQAVADAALQRAFVESIHQSNKDRRTFDTADQLCRMVLRDGWQIQSRPPHRPTQLPYHSIGTLFKGRDKFLQQLHESLSVGRRAPTSNQIHATAIVGRAVHGLGGVGKTRLAVEYAWQRADDYSAMLFVTADSSENLRRELAALTGPLVLDLPEHTATEEEAKVAAALRWLNEHPGWLLILDNADSEDVARHVEDLLARLSGGQVLITSRLGKWCDVVEPLELDVLADEDGATLLLEKTQPKSSGRGRKPTSADEADALELARELDGLALALEQAGAYIAQLRMSLREYLKLWRSHAPKVQEWFDRTIQYAGPADKPMRSVAVTWQASLEQLSGREIQLLDLLAWFAPEPVPLSVFSDPSAISEYLRVEKEAENAEDAEHAEQEHEWSEDSLREALANLVDFSMIHWNVVGETVSVHRVVQEILRTRQPEPNQFLTAALRLLNAARPKGDAHDVRTWPAWEPLRPHVAFATLEADQRKIDEPTTELMGELGTLLWAKALHGEADQLDRRALAIDQRHHGPDSIQVASRLNDLAQTLEATNRLAEAEPLMRRAVEILRASLGEEHPNTVTAVENNRLLREAMEKKRRLAE